MLKVGLTGGIASGKSTVGEMFAARGVLLIQADQVSHQMMQPGEPLHREVVRHFGAGILNSDGTVNRPRLAEVAFGDPSGGRPSRIQELNQIVHPAVIRRQEEWMEEVGRQHPQAIAMVEAALILEADFARSFDALVVVTCLPEQRIRRWAEHMHLSEADAQREVARRMAAQLPDEEKVKAADYVIDNSGSLDETQRQVERVYAQLRERALGSKPDPVAH